MPYIDAHVHVWTDDRDRYPRARQTDVKPDDFPAEELLRHCRPSGVERIVLVQVSFYGFDNSYMLDTMERHPGTFSGIALVDWNGPKPDEAMRQLSERGVRGFRITPGGAPTIEQWLDTQGFRRMFAAGADLGLALCPLINPDALPSLARMCRAFPQTPVVIDHLCRIGAGGSIREEEIEALCGMARFPAVKVKLSAFYALGAKQPPHEELVPLLRRVYEAFGPRRLMWASDSPFAVQNETYEDSISLLRDRLEFLTEEDRRWILEKTAAAAFFE